MTSDLTSKHATEEHRRIAREGTILRVLVGSGLHGTSVSDQDDRDEMGVCIEPAEYVIGLRTIEGHVFEQLEYKTAWGRPGDRANRSGPGDLDEVVYSLRKWARLALEGNPTTLLPLFAPESAIVSIEPLGRELRGLAPLIVSRRAAGRFAGYLDRQRQSMLSRDGKGRDVTRADLVERYGFDVKYAGHMARLGFQGVELLTTGRITLPMPAVQGQFVRSVRMGNVPMQEVLDLAENLEARLLDLAETSPMRAEPDRDAVDAWLISAYQRAWKEQGQ
jgi:hypothetical protein